MFESYTEKARRVIFFARFEASRYGTPQIDTDLLLLGLVRENLALLNRFLVPEASDETLRDQVLAHTPMRESIPTSVDLPLSNGCQRVLAYAAEEAGRMGHKHIGPEHLFLGLLRERHSFAAKMLRERGANIGVIRKKLAAGPAPEFTDRSPRNPRPLSAADLDEYT
jgi:ATP-dependent Clp protease ATP-binding subunit ClpC